MNQSLRSLTLKPYLMNSSRFEEACLVNYLLRVFVLDIFRYWFINDSVYFINEGPTEMSHWKLSRWHKKFNKKCFHTFAEFIVVLSWVFTGNWTIFGDFLCCTFPSYTRNSELLHLYILTETNLLLFTFWNFNLGSFMSTDSKTGFQCSSIYGISNFRKNSVIMEKRYCERGNSKFVMRENRSELRGPNYAHVSSLICHFTLIIFFNCKKMHLENHNVIKTTKLEIANMNRQVIWKQLI